jgi:endonuclease/exonuclease/phosphatase family metal-dependent hydrolase
LLITNCIVAAPLLLFYVDAFPSPAESDFVVLMPFGFAAVFIINILFILIWIFLKWKYLFISLITVLIGVTYISAIFPLPSYLNSTNRDGEIKIMTYNAMLFGLYDWQRNHEIKDSIIGLIVNERADILCLQEVYWNKSKQHFAPLEDIMKNASFTSLHKQAMATAIQGQNFGLATLSVYPVVATDFIKFENSFNGVIFTDLLVDDDTIRVYNCHMQSIQLNQNDYTIIGSMADSTDNAKMRFVLKKIIEASKQRAKQTDIVANAIANSPYPVIVCGDLNDFPLSYTYLNLSKGLRDSYSVKGKYPGVTWDNFGIRQRIDVIFYDKKFKCTSHKVIEKSFSDHYPVVAEFER